MSSEELPKEIPFDRFVKDIQFAHKMRGEYLAFIYDELKKRYGKQTSKDILSKAIFEYGKYRGKRAIRQNPKLRMGNAKDFRPSPLTAFALHKTVFLEETPERLVYRHQVCPIIDALNDLGKTEEELRDICDIAEANNDGKVTIYRDEIGITDNWPKMICHGDPYCEHVFHKVKEK